MLGHQLTDLRSTIQRRPRARCGINLGYRRPSPNADWPRTSGRAILPSTHHKLSIMGIFLLACFTHEAHSGYGGGTTVNSSVIVGAAASCTGDNTIYPLTANTYTGVSPQLVGRITARCPGATFVYAGIVGGDGTVGLRTGRQIGNGVVPVTTWSTSICASVEITENVLQIGLDTNDYETVLTGWGLPTNTYFLQKKDGPDAAFSVYLTTPKCTALTTGVYPYTIKIYGYWP
ncbi:Uncharacterised protein [Serratia liquefaciens]|nr:Uncharacterised protein [Serratia quinivorans]CAI1085853.1 Uncharacterised protein [Serratia quinivorans]CAI2122453.1 Uncharacterised protein [Serratia quinivorans]CAI2489532.1 Uncharacterised protein [Serratia liquefaciens]